MLESSDLDSTKRTNRWDRIGKNITRGQYLVYSRKYPSLPKKWKPWMAIVFHVSQASIIELWQLLNNIILVCVPDCDWLLWHQSNGIVAATSILWSKLNYLKRPLKTAPQSYFLKSQLFVPQHIYSLLYLTDIFSSSDKKTSLLEDNLVSCLW